MALARRLAQLIDQERGEESEAAVLIKLGAEFRATLTSLGLTPAARAAQHGKAAPDVEQPPVKSPLQQARDEVAAQRARRGAS